MSRFILLAGAISNALAVIIGAFGAHALKATLDAYSSSVFSTANDYHFYHSLGLLLIGVMALLRPAWLQLRTAAILMLGGILLFSGSLYLLAVTGMRWLGMITPVGGLLFIFSWIVVIYCVYRNG